MAEATTRLRNPSGASTACFLSYRRSTGGLLARLIYEYLDARKYWVSLDYEFIGAGDFKRAIRQRILDSPFFLPILTPQTLQRCQESSDVLLMEYETAIEAEACIVPLLTPRFNRKDIDKYLPGRIASEFNRVNSLTVDEGQQFRACMNRLMHRYLVPPSNQRWFSRVEPSPHLYEEPILRPEPVGEIALSVQPHLEGALAALPRAPARARKEFDLVAQMVPRKPDGTPEWDEVVLTADHLDALMRAGSGFSFLSNLMKMRQDVAKAKLDWVR